MNKLSAKQYEQIWKNFVEFYLENGFGNKLKSNIEIYMFNLLEKTGYFSDCKTTHDYAIKLRITPKKMSNLMLQSALQKQFQIEDYQKKVLTCLGSKARIVNKDRISFDIDDVRVRLAIKTICQEKGIYTDSSFNRNIISFSLESYAKILEAFIPEKKKENVEKEILKAIKNVEFDIKIEELKENVIFKILKKGFEIYFENTIGSFKPQILIEKIATIISKTTIK